jgi:8-oxo-dGTP pyrophosphatase MutT (NUDIX family)
MEVLMLRRQLSSVFVGGAYVFPGGGVDPEDRGPEAAARCRGRDDAEASRLLEIDSGALGYFVATVRECFEEAGLLLAEGADGAVSFADPVTDSRFTEHRRRLNAGEITFAAILQEEDLFLPLDRLCYFSHWITPVGAPRRYDTRFFVAIVPEGQVALHDDAEVIASEWVRPADALARHHAGELDLMFPTIRHLEAIGRFSSSLELWSAAAAAEVPTIQPRITVEGPGVRILLPGDPGFDEATGLPEGIPFPDRPIGVEGA